VTNRSGGSGDGNSYNEKSLVRTKVRPLFSEYPSTFGMLTGSKTGGYTESDEASDLTSAFIVEAEVGRKAGILIDRQRPSQVLAACEAQGIMSSPTSRGLRSPPAMTRDWPRRSDLGATPAQVALAGLRAVPPPSCHPPDHDEPGHLTRQHAPPSRDTNLTGDRG